VNPPGDEAHLREMLEYELLPLLFVVRRGSPVRAGCTSRCRIPALF
jgi:hypothetical protein